MECIPKTERIASFVRKYINRQHGPLHYVLICCSIQPSVYTFILVRLFVLSCLFLFTIMSEKSRRNLSFYCIYVRNHTENGTLGECVGGWMWVCGWVVL
jgi:hypothetical protein